MPVRIERLGPDAHVVRLYDVDDGSRHPPYIASAVLEWADTSTVWIRALQGRLTRQVMRDLLHALVNRGVHVVLAERADGHSLPMAEPGADGVLRLDVRALAQRLAGRCQDYYEADETDGDAAV